VTTRSELLPGGIPSLRFLREEPGPRQAETRMKPRTGALLLLNLAVAGALVWHADPLAAKPPQWRLPATTDPLRAATAIARHQVHGHADDYVSSERKSEIAFHRPIRATCGAVSLWAVDLLTEAGFDARLDMVMTLDPWNASNNGHTFVEIRTDGRWVAYDLDRKVRWTDEAGRPLSMSKWVARVPSGNYRIVPLLGPVNERELRAEDRRVAQVPFVLSGGHLWFPSAGERTQSLLNYPKAKDYRVLSPSAWEARFGERVPPLRALWWRDQDGRLTP
jgi:hypothetical protein